MLNGVGIIAIMFVRKDRNGRMYRLRWDRADPLQSADTIQQ